MRINHPWWCLIAIVAGIQICYWTKISPPAVMFGILALAVLLGLWQFFTERAKRYRPPADHADSDEFREER